MEKASSLSRKWQIVVFFLTALAVLASDQLSKAWIRSHLAIGESLPETGWIRLTYVRNTGSSFGLFQNQFLPLTVVAVAGAIVLVYLALLGYRRFPFLDKVSSQITLGLVLGGTLGNLVDRLRFGYITDFIDFGFWPAFNVADSAIVIGVAAFAYLLLSLVRAEKH